MNESERLGRLADYRFLDTEPDETLDEMVALAASVCDAPISVVSFVDAERLWFKACVGVTATQLSRENAFCAHAVAAEGEAIFTVQDAREDPRFSCDALVTGAPHIVFYAGAPLVVDGGAKLGTLCVIDDKPRTLTSVQEQTLRTLAKVVVRHIEDRRRARDLVTFRSFVEMSPDFIVFGDCEGRLTYLNPAGRKLIGLESLQAACELNVADVFTTNEVVPTSPTGTAGHFHGESELRHVSSGDAIPIARDSFVVRDEQNRLIAEATVGRDLRVQRAMEAAAKRQAREAEVAREQVRASEAAWRMVTDALPVLVSFVTADARYGLVNRAYEDWFGLAREDLLGQKVREIIGEAAYAVLGPNVERGLRGERLDFEQHGVPYRLGGTRDVKVKFVPHREATGAPAGYTALLEDVTVQRRVEQERDRLSRQRTKVLEAMGDAFLALDAQWSIILFNGEYERMTGKARHELEGRDVREIFPELRDPKSEYFKGYQRCMTERVPVAFTTYSDVSDLWLDVRIFATGEGGISVFYRDVSADKRAEVAARKKTDFERQLIGIVSHDLRNPLNAILVGSKLLRRQEDLSAASTRFVVRIENAAERSMRLIRDLLDFTQAELGGGIRIERRPGDIHELTRFEIEEIQALHPRRSLEVRAGGDGAGEWDSDRLSQVIQNLVTNALKYSSAGSAVTVSTGDEGAAVSLVVHNFGPSIPPALIPTMFEPFERGAVHSDTALRSVGLGLYIVERVVKAHGGSVEVSSNDQDGTTFKVRLPRRSDKALG